MDLTKSTQDVREIKKTGRPRTPEYTKKRFRYAAIEKRINPLLDQFESDYDRELLQKFLEELRGAENGKKYHK